MDLSTLEAMLIKQGVMLGGLTPEQRAAALAVVWAGLPDAVMNEKHINQALQHSLANAAQFLDTDHVELRRWLVDVGWLQRDGFGREYRRLNYSHLPAPCKRAADLLPKPEVDAWAQALRLAQARRREERRLLWQTQADAKQPASTQTV
jgi:Uncharacterized protein conserved in bacteria (DUF2087)